MKKTQGAARTLFLKLRPGLPTAFLSFEAERNFFTRGKIKRENFYGPFTKRRVQYRGKRRCFEEYKRAGKEFPERRDVFFWFLFIFVLVN
jgi:hypothetical protein